MTNVLDQIAETSLEGTVKYVDTTEQCASCDRTIEIPRIGTAKRGWKHFYKRYPRVGDTLVLGCTCSAEKTTWKVIKITPCEDQNDY